MRLSAQKIALMICLLAISPLICVRAQQDDSLSDKEIKVVSFEELHYPALARTARIQGVVVTRAKLDNQGNVVDAVGVSGSGLLLPISLENVKKWRFEPNARKSVIVVYNFTILEGRCNSYSSLFILQGPNLARVITCPPQVNVSSSR
jgi:hypothetical protein